MSVTDRLVHVFLASFYDDAGRVLDCWNCIYLFLWVERGWADCSWEVHVRKKFL